MSENHGPEGTTKSGPKKGLLNWRISWLFISVLFPITLVLLYVASAVPVQVLFVNGYFKDKPHTFRFLEVAYTPLERMLDKNPQLNATFESTVQSALQRQKKNLPAPADKPSKAH